MRPRDQLIGAVVLCVATWFSLMRIAESKNEAAVGSATYSLASGHAPEREAFDALRLRLERAGQRPFSIRLEALRAANRVWIAPALGPERWAVFVESLGLVRRIYIRRLALLDPRGHLAEQGASEASSERQELFAWLSLCGALRHELAHYDGRLDEAAAYAQEQAWYEELRASPFVKELRGREGDVWQWALDSAVLSAREAARREGSR
jgi:hypothetical protein